MKRLKQLSLNDVYADCLESIENDKPKFLSMLEEHLDIDAFIPLRFRRHFRKHTGRPREYSLSAFMLALNIRRIFSIQTDSFLIIFLTYSQELREFFGFDNVPDASKFTRFKQDFRDDLKNMFDILVDFTEPICQGKDSKLVSIAIFDTSGIEAYVQENNPKFINALIKRLKSWKNAINTASASAISLIFGKYKSPFFKSLQLLIQLFLQSMILLFYLKLGCALW